MTEQYYKNEVLQFIGWKSLRFDETVSIDDRAKEIKAQHGSNKRRIWSRVNIFIVALFVYIVFCECLPSNSKLTVPGILFSIYALAYFFIVVVITPFRSSESFNMNANRLFSDTIISSILVIMCFSTVYAGLGTSHKDDNIVTMIYFSAVTFSTLGFGDIKPDSAAQLPAALQAIIGNIHLGMLVGSTFAAIQKSTNN